MDIKQVHISLNYLCSNLGLRDNETNDLDKEISYLQMNIY